MELENILSQVKAVAEKQKQEAVRGADPRILEFKQGGTYIGRIVPFGRKTEKGLDYADTIVTWSEIGFPNQVDTKGYVFAGRSPGDFKVKDDIFNKTQWEEYKKAKDKGDEAKMKLTYKLFPQRKQAFNFYLHSVKGDEDAAEKVGGTWIVKYSAGLDKKQNPVSDLFKIVYDGLFGEYQENIGTRAFDLSPAGRSLIIKVTEKGGWNNYSSSKFDDAKDLKLSKSQIEEIKASAHDLQEIIPAMKSQEELKKLLDDYWFGKSSSPEDDADSDDSDAKDDDNIDLSPAKDSNVDQEVDDLLKEI